MAHSYVTFRDKSVFFRDDELYAFIYTVIHEHNKQRNSTASSLDDLVAWSARIVDECGPDLLDLKLDRYLTNQDVVNDLLALIDKSIGTIRQFGKMVPGDFFNNMIRGIAIRYYDQNVGRLLKQFHELRSFFASIAVLPEGPLQLE